MNPKASTSRFALPPCSRETDDDNGLGPTEIMSGRCNGRRAFAGGWNTCASYCNGSRIDMGNEWPAQVAGSSEVDEVGEVWIVSGERAGSAGKAVVGGRGSAWQHGSAGVGEE